MRQGDEGKVVRVRKFVRPRVEVFKLEAFGNEEIQPGGWESITCELGPTGDLSILADDRGAGDGLHLAGEYPVVEQFGGDAGSADARRDDHVCVQDD
jgi:hypothetical protein